MGTIKHAAALPAANVNSGKSVKENSAEANIEQMANAIVQELETLGSPTTKKVLLKHGAKEPLFAVKVEDLKKIQKRLKMNQPLASALYATGISDAMYLAGLIADDSCITKEELQRWAEQASWSMLSENTVAWVAAGSRYGYPLALEWIDDPRENIVTSGWTTLSSLVAIKDDLHLDLDGLRALLKRVQETIHDRPNRVRSTMNGFVIAVGCCVPALTECALETARSMGKVSVAMGDTSCKVPSAEESIRKAMANGTVGKKRKTAKC